jgi:glycosyltransferase involved in cell wall biosynthesis
LKQAVRAANQTNISSQHEETNSRRSLLSVVTPAYNEAQNLPLLYERLCQVLDELDIDWEWIIVDDHSPDSTFPVVADIARQDRRVRAFRFARNYGSHTGIVCGLDHAGGDCVVVLAADLQDPPEVIPELLEKWRDGAQVVWAVRAHREGEQAISVGFSRLYYFLMRRVFGIDVPSTGADFFVLDRRVVHTLRRFNERHVSILLLIIWLGFRQETIAYDKQPRIHGHSGWSIEKKLKLVVDSVTSFSYLPIRLMSCLGFVITVLGFLYALVVLINALSGNPPQGWMALMVAVLVIGGVQMLMLGVLGEYLWRALDEARARPRYVIEEMLEAQDETA